MKNGEAKQDTGKMRHRKRLLAGGLVTASPERDRPFGEHEQVRDEGDDISSIIRGSEKELLADRDMQRGVGAGDFLSNANKDNAGQRQPGDYRSLLARLGSK